jgi:hypothetical protein
LQAASEELLKAAGDIEARAGERAGAMAGLEASALEVKTRADAVARAAKAVVTARASGQAVQEEQAAHALMLAWPLAGAALRMVKKKVAHVEKALQSETEARLANAGASVWRDRCAALESSAQAEEAACSAYERHKQEQVKLAEGSNASANAKLEALMEANPVDEGVPFKVAADTTTGDYAAVYIDRVKQHVHNAQVAARQAAERSLAAWAEMDRYAPAVDAGKKVLAEMDQAQAVATDNANAALKVMAEEKVRPVKETLKGGIWC